MAETQSIEVDGKEMNIEDGLKAAAEKVISLQEGMNKDQSMKARKHIRGEIDKVIEAELPFCIFSTLEMEKVSKFTVTVTLKPNKKEGERPYQLFIENGISAKRKDGWDCDDVGGNLTIQEKLPL